jgi:hypothetical protein
MIPTERFRSAIDDTVTPFLFWSELAVCAGGAALACPQCAAPNLHLNTVWFATPTEDHYTPTVGVSIAPPPARSSPTTKPAGYTPARTAAPCCQSDTGAKTAAGGRIELREHKGHLVASLHTQPPLRPEDLP